MSADLEPLLAAQDLTIADLEANRAGRVSAHQAALVMAHRRQLAPMPILIALGLFVASIGFAAYRFHTEHRAVVFVMPLISLAFGAGLVALVFTVFMLPKIDGQAVTVVEGPVKSVFLVPNRGGYLLGLNGVAYKGVATGVATTLRGRAVKAYVIADRKMVVAIEPA